MTDIVDPQHARRDLRLAEQAIRKDWQIPEQVMTGLPKIAANLAVNGTPRERIAAMRVLIAMKAQNDQPQQQQGTTINVGVQVDNSTTNDRRARSRAIAERFGARRILRDDVSGSGRGNLPTTGESDDE